MSAVRLGIPRQRPREARNVRHGGFPDQRRAGEALRAQARRSLQGRAGRQKLMHPQGMVEAEGVGQRQPGPQPGLRQQAVLVKRHQARLRLDQARRGREQNLPLFDVLAHPRKVQRPQRPEAAEHQAAPARHGSAPPVFRLKQRRPQPAQRGVPRDPRPKQPAADDN